MADQIPIHEFTCNGPVFCDGLVSADLDQNGNVRLIFYVDQADHDGSNRCRMIVERMVIPQGAMSDMVGLLVNATSSEKREFARHWQSGKVAHA